jgi:hypothetical protein
MIRRWHISMHRPVVRLKREQDPVELPWGELHTKAGFKFCPKGKRTGHKTSVL